MVLHIFKISNIYECLIHWYIKIVVYLFIYLVINLFTYLTIIQQKKFLLKMIWNNNKIEK